MYSNLNYQIDDEEFEPLWDFCNGNDDEFITSEELTECVAVAAKYVHVRHVRHAKYGSMSDWSPVRVPNNFYQKFELYSD